MDFEALTDDGERDLDFFSNKDVNDIEVDGDFLNFFKTFQQDGGEIEEIHPNEREKSKDENGFFWERKMNEHASIHGENKSKNIPEKEKLTGALQPSKPLFFKSSDDAEGWITKTSREKRNSSAELQKIQEQSKKFPKKVSRIIFASKN